MMHATLLGSSEMLVLGGENIDQIYPMNEAEVAVDSVKFVVLLNEWLMRYTQLTNSALRGEPSIINEPLLLSGEMFEGTTSGEAITIRVYDRNTDGSVLLTMSLPKAVEAHAVFLNCLLQPFVEAGGRISEVQGIERVKLCV